MSSICTYAQRRSGIIWMDTSEKVWHISDIIVETCVHLLHGYANVIVDAGIVNIDFVCARLCAFGQFLLSTCRWKFRWVKNGFIHQITSANLMVQINFFFFKVTKTQSINHPSLVTSQYGGEPNMDRDKTTTESRKHSTNTRSTVFSNIDTI